MLVVPSPAAIMKNTPNLAAAKKFIDFLLTVDAQTIIAEEGTLPVRTDVKIPEAFNMPSPAEALKRAIPINYQEMMDNKQEFTKKYTDIMQGKG